MVFEALLLMTVGSHPSVDCLLTLILTISVMFQTGNPLAYAAKELYY